MKQEEQQPTGQEPELYLEEVIEITYPDGAKVRLASPYVGLPVLISEALRIRDTMIHKGKTKDSPVGVS